MSIKIIAQKPDYIYLCYAYDTTSNTFGYINTKGKFAIKPQYLLAFNFSDNHAFVQFKDSTWGLINFKGEKVYSLPDSLGKGVTNKFRPKDPYKTTVTYMDPEYNGNIQDYFRNMELKDSFLMFERDWFSDSFNTYLNTHTSCPNSSEVKLYYHIKRGLLKDNNDVPIYGLGNNSFSEKLIIVWNEKLKLRVMNNFGKTLFTIPDSIGQPTYNYRQKIIIPKFCGGKMHIYEFANGHYKDENGKIQIDDDRSRFKIEYIIYSNGKIEVNTDTTALKIICDNLLYHKIYHKTYSKNFKMRGDIYSAWEIHYGVSASESFHYMAYNCNPPNDKNFLKPFSADLFMAYKTKSYSESDGYKYHELIGFWDNKHRIKIKPRVNGHIGKEFRKVYTK